MKYIRGIIYIFVAMGMIADTLMGTFNFYGVGIGMLLLSAIEDIANDSVRK